jgi:hypothetical protein
VTSTGLTLIRVKNSVKTTDTSITFAGNVTLTAVAAAVNALGNGWSAQVTGDATNYGSWPSADRFWPPAFPTFGTSTAGQGALQCVAGSFAELKMHIYELAGFQWDARGWLLRAIPYTDPELLHPEDLVWPVGINNLRIQYTAGYATITAFQISVAPPISQTQILSLVADAAGDGFERLTGNGGFRWREKFVTRVDVVLVRSTIHRIAVPGRRLRAQPAGSASN